MREEADTARVTTEMCHQFFFGGNCIHNMDTSTAFPRPLCAIGKLPASRLLLLEAARNEVNLPSPLPPPLFQSVAFGMRVSLRSCRVALFVSVTAAAAAAAFATLFSLAEAVPGAGATPAESGGGNRDSAGTNRCDKHRTEPVEGRPYPPTSHPATPRPALPPPSSLHSLLLVFVRPRR